MKYSIGSSVLNSSRGYGIVSAHDATNKMYQYLVKFKTGVIAWLPEYALKAVEPRPVVYMYETNDK